MRQTYNVSDWDSDSELHSKDVYYPSDLTTGLISTNDSWWTNVFQFPEDLFVDSTHPKTHSEMSETASEPSSSNCEPTTTPIEPQIISESSNESSAQSSGTSAPKKRPRGRPPINDPIVKAQRKKVSQIKAAQKYRRKRKEYSSDAEKLAKFYFIENNRLKSKLIHQYNEAKQMLRKCQQLTNLKTKEKNKIKKSEKVIHSILFN